MLEWLRQHGLEKVTHLVASRVLPTGRHLLNLTTEALTMSLNNAKEENTKLDINVFLEAVEDIKKQEVFKSASGGQGRR